MNRWKRGCAIVVAARNRAIVRQEPQKPVTGTGVSEKGGSPELIE
jgi:hypothetical protein